MAINLRRARLNSALRDSLATVDIRANQLIQPYFVYEGLKSSEALPSISGQFKHTADSLADSIEKGLQNGVTTQLLFIIPKEKGNDNFSYDFDCKVLSKTKERFGSDINLWTDICLCSQTNSGHCGHLDKDGYVDNDKTVLELARKSLLYAQAGSDGVCPSDMMDNRIGAIRDGLDRDGEEKTILMSYSTKFSSNLYGPFRDAAESTPSKGDRKSYQIDFRNANDALASSLRDAEQGADILMVKPAGFYLDIIHRIKSDERLSHIPLAAYQVSGEYQSLHLMSENNLMDFNKGYIESLYAIKRAGADLIITYGANEFSEIIKE